jgi:hypothetical protein
MMLRVAAALTGLWILSYGLLAVLLIGWGYVYAIAGGQSHDLNLAQGFALTLPGLAVTSFLAYEFMCRRSRRAIAIGMVLWLAIVVLHLVTAPWLAIGGELPAAVLVAAILFVRRDTFGIGDRAPSR